MDIYETIARRKSVRSYRMDPIDDAILVKIFQAARGAPSAMNLQPSRFIVVRDPVKRKSIAQSGRFARFIDQAPVVVVACGDKRSSFYIHDTCIALEHMVLAATAEGLGTCWIGSFTEETLRPLLGIPAQFKVVALVAMGYPTEKKSYRRTLLKGLRKTRSLADIAFLEMFGTSFTTDVKD